MITTHQQFVFEDGSYSELPGLIFSSRYATLHDAVTDAAAVSGILVIDQNWPSIDDIAIGCDVMAGGGLISWISNMTSMNTITVTGRVIGNSQIFDVTAWGGDPSLTGSIGSRSPLSPFPVALSNCTDANAAWFGACTATTATNTRLALQAAFCSVGIGAGGPSGCTVRIPGGYTYVFDRNTVNDMIGPAYPYGILIPEQRDIVVEADGAIFDYQGSEASVGAGTCAFGWYSDQPAALSWLGGLEWRGGIAAPSAVQPNSDFMWLNNIGSRLTVRNLKIGEANGAAAGHRHGIVQCKWISTQAFTGQRIVIDNCDITTCTDTAMLIIQCDAALITGCRISNNGGSGVELGCDGFRSYNNVMQSGTCSSPKIISCNFEVNVKSGVKCIDVRDSLITSDFESNAIGQTSSDANIDFTALFQYLPANTGNSTVASPTLTGLSFDPTDPMLSNWQAGMFVRDKQGKIPAGRSIVSLTSTTITLSGNVTSTNTGLILAAFVGSGDKEGRAECCTLSNSQTAGNAFNVITQSSTVLDENLHKGVTADEIGVLHLASDQPLWCTKEVFTKKVSGAHMTFFSSDSFNGGVINRESATPFMLAYNTAIAAGGKVQLTPTFQFNGEAVMVEAAGLSDVALGASASYLIGLYDVTGAPVLVQNLTAGSSVWEEGPYSSQRVGARLAHLTQATVSGWVSTKSYAIFASNGSAANGNFAGGVVVRFCQIVPPT
ncbi:MAG TPA: right-handed parallel beta-helix repeat-containing protein [Rhizomicrobium sp.]|jgi:hypothetical protein